MSGAVCRDARRIKCLCEVCGHKGCCLRSEHIGIACPVQECPDYKIARRPADRPMTAAEAMARSAAIFAGRYDQTYLGELARETPRKK